jgi:outer membrane biogenesis lipoprotein LolB
MRALRLLAVLLLAGCASSSLAPVGSETALEADEKRMWQRSEEEQRAIERSGLVYAGGD